MYRGTAKSNPVWENGGSSDTLSGGKSATGHDPYGLHSSLLQITQALTIALVA